MSALTIDIRVRTTSPGHLPTTIDPVRPGVPLGRGDAAHERGDGRDQSGATPSSFVTISGVAFTGVVAADKATWDGAQLKLRWAYTVVGSSDTAQLKLTRSIVHATPARRRTRHDGAGLPVGGGERLDADDDLQRSPEHVSVPATSDFAITVRRVPSPRRTDHRLHRRPHARPAVVAGDTVTCYTKPARTRSKTSPATTPPTSTTPPSPTTPRRSTGRLPSSSRLR